LWLKGGGGLFLPPFPSHFPIHLHFFPHFWPDWPVGFFSRATRDSII
jgi:hypothetical protein